ncbi:hypothetical protein R5R35_006780 [Gryllus longicercus]|uniref:RIB43A-like with coiled-coils protein 2 n=1 Tax=Gryllus longicercus TaxID=2509291 RepID=A0AAN9Z238_9ORTH
MTTSEGHAASSKLSKPNYLGTVICSSVFGFMKMLLTKCDVAQAAAIERRRRYDEERRERIFNPRRRLIGIDKEALDQQVQERKQKELEERQINNAFDELRVQNDKLALLLEQSLLEERRKINKEINVFRSTYQGPEARREYEIPARVDDTDSRCGSSSGQKFPGEDLGSKDREKAQKEQNKAWLEQQILERKSTKNEQKRVEESYDQILMSMDKRSCEIEYLERKCRRQLNETVKQYNKFMADERAQYDNAQKQKEQEDNMAEVCHSMLGDLLCENSNVHQSSLGPHRVRGSMYKGMSEEERMEFRILQRQQIEEKIVQRAEEARLEAEWNKLSDGIAYNVFMKDKENAKKQREIEKQIVEQNKILSVEQKERQHFLNKYVYTSNLSDDFYKQFNTTTR